MSTRFGFVSAVVLGCLLALPARAEIGLAILDFELNDLTLQPGTPEELRRTASLKPLLERSLGAKGRYRIVAVDAAAQATASKGQGYPVRTPGRSRHAGQPEREQVHRGGHAEQAEFPVLVCRSARGRRQGAESRRRFLRRGEGAAGQSSRPKASTTSPARSTPGCNATGRPNSHFRPVAAIAGAQSAGLNTGRFGSTIASQRGQAYQVSASCPGPKQSRPSSASMGIRSLPDPPQPHSPQRYIERSQPIKVALKGDIAHLAGWPCAPN